MIFFKLRELILGSLAKRDKFILASLISGLLANILIWAILVFNFWQASEYIILRYNVYFGISALGSWYNVFLMPALGLVVLAVDFLFSFFFYLRFRILSYFFSVAALVFNLMILLVGILLVYANL